MRGSPGGSWLLLRLALGVRYVRSGTAKQGRECARSVSSGGPVQSRFTASVLVLAATAALAACGDSDNPVGTPNANTTVRFFNATNSLALDVAQNGTVVSGSGGIPFGAASTCMKVNDADPKLSIRAAGTTSDLAGFTPSFSAGNTYTVLVTGTATAPVFTTLDDQFTPAGANTAGVRIVNATAAAGAGTWDVYVNPTETLGTPNATAVTRNSATAFLTVPSGQTNTVRLTAAGQTARLQDIAVPSLVAGTATTIVVTDPATVGATALEAFTLPPCPT